MKRSVMDKLFRYILKHFPENLLKLLVAAELLIRLEKEHTLQIYTLEFTLQ